MDWSNPSALSDALKRFQTQTDTADDAQSHITLPHDRLNINADNIRLRALAGLIQLHDTPAQTDQSPDNLLPLLEAALSTGDLDRDTRLIIHEKIAAIEAAKQQRVRDALAALPRQTDIDTDPPPLSAQEPVHWLMQESDDRCTVRFGYELASVSAVDNAPGTNLEGAVLLKMLTQTLNAWKDRLGLGLEADFIWRYWSTGNRVRLMLLVDVHSPEPEMAQEAADGLQHVILQHMPLPAIYRFAPLTDKDDLKRLSQSDGFASAAEIVRQEESLEREGRFFYAVYPVNVDSDRLHDLLRYLHNSPPGQVVDITIRPATITHAEIEAAMEVITQGFDINSQDDSWIRVDTDDIPVDEQRREALTAYHQMLSRLRRQAFHVRVRVASTTRKDILPLATVTGRSLLGLSTFEILPATYNSGEMALDDLVPRTLAPPELERLRWLWSAAETALVTRLPRTTRAGIPGVVLSRLRQTRIPSDLPDDGCLLGHALSDNYSNPEVRLPYIDRTRHVYVVGRTGTGKTTLLHNMVLQDIENGEGVGVIDPHGDLIDALLARIPPERADDVILFDPGDVERPVGLNLLDVEGVVAQNMAVADFIGLMYSMYDPQRQGIVGPRFEQSVRNSMYTAMSLPGATLIDVLRVIADKKYSRAVRNHLEDPVINAYWDTIYDTQSDFHISEVKDYITSKFSRFTADRMVRQIISQPRTSLDFADIFDSKKILLVNLAKGRIGEFNSSFLGFILVSQLLIAAFQRVEYSFDRRTPFYLYIDEFQNFATPGLASMLSEGRKYGLALTLAHQFTHQLDHAMQEAVFGNIGTLLAFQVGLKDATYLSREMYPVFEADDLVNLPSYHVAAKILSHKQTLRPFVLKTLAERRTPSAEIAGAVRDFSRFTYGRNAAIVADQIRDQFFLSVEDRLNT